MKYPPCIARVVLKPNGECCLNRRTGKFKQPVTPAECQACEYKRDNELEGPTALQKLANLAKSAAQAARNPTFASEEEQARRMGICGPCKFQVTANTCTACGCHLRYKIKLNTWRCDLGFWDEGADPPPIKDQDILEDEV